MRSIVLSAILCGVLAGGCRVEEENIHHWGKTERGPFKLVAVIAHDKYKMPLRVEAAMTLTRMPPRQGQRKGISFLVDKYKDEEGETKDGALVVLPTESRKQVIAGIIPQLITEMQKPPPKRDEKTGRADPDPTVPFKDMAFAILSHEPPLLTDEKMKSDLIAALIQWANTGFEERIDNASQQYGVEQMLRYLGAATVKQLPSLLNENAYRIDRIAGLIADIGDEDTKKRGSDALVALAKRVLTSEWGAAQTKIVKEYNETNAKAGAPKATDEQVAVQVGKIQERRLNEEIFPAMKRVGGRPAVDFLLGFANDTKNSDDRRKTALAALEGRVDKNSASDLDKIFAVAKSDSTTDVVRDVAFQRLGEFPKEQILPRLYSLFESSKWKVRWIAGSLVLKTQSTKSIAEFMRHLPTSEKQKMGMTEPLSYGELIAKMEAPNGEPKARDVIMPYLQAKEIGPKLTAIGYFYNGKKADQGVLKSLEEDRTPVPHCDKDDDCRWSCEVPKAGGKEMDMKEITTIGEMVKLCVIPSMTNN